MSDPILEALNRRADEVSEEDIENIIAYLRKTRQQYEGGVKPKKEGAAPASELIKALNLSPPKASPGFKRRV